VCIILTSATRYCRWRGEERDGRGEAAATALLAAEVAQGFQMRMGLQLLATVLAEWVGVRERALLRQAAMTSSWVGLAGRSF